MGAPYYIGKTMTTYEFQVITADLRTVVTVNADTEGQARCQAIAQVRKFYGTRIGPGVPITLGQFTIRPTDGTETVGVCEP